MMNIDKQHIKLHVCHPVIDCYYCWEVINKSPLTPNNWGGGIGLFQLMLQGIFS